MKTIARIAASIVLMFCLTAPDAKAEEITGGSGQVAGEKWTFELTVIDKQTGKPIPDANLKIVAGNRHFKVMTRENGKRTIRLNKVPDYLSITAGKDGLVPMQVTWRSLDEKSLIPNRYTLALEPGTSIGGIIQDEKGKPIEGASVYLLVPGKADETERVAIRDYEVKTDAAGRWRCNIVPICLDNPGACYFVHRG